MSQPENIDVFISYSTKNKDIADAIVSDFESHEINCWYAPRNIAPGVEWVSAITDALEKTKILVLIFTEDSNESRQVMNEIALQFNANKPIVPFRLSDVEMSREFGYYLTRVHWFDALDKPLDQGISELRYYIISILNGETPIENDFVPTLQPERKENKKRNAFLYLLLIPIAVFFVFIGFSISTLINKIQDIKIASSYVIEEPSEEEPGDIIEEETEREKDEDKEKEPETVDQTLITADYLLNKEYADELSIEETELLGQMFFYGRTIAQDYNNAYYYLFKAYELGDVSGETCVLLGDCYYYGNGITLNEEKARDFYLEAIEKGIDDAKVYNNIAFTCYLRQEYDMSAYYFSKVAELNNDSMAMGNTGISYYEMGDYQNALLWFGKAINSNADYSSNYKSKIRTMVNDGNITEEEASKWLD